MLERFKKVKEKEVELLALKEKTGTFPAPFQGPKPSLLKALREKSPRYKVIAEYKRSSPSKGVINKHLSPEEVAWQYKQAGATALSILTEREFFAGELDFISRVYPVGLPVLRKDFLYHPLQIKETLSTPARAVLLIVRFFEDFAQLKDMYELALEVGLEPVVEVFSFEDLELAKKLNPFILQVNSRDLDSLKIDLTTFKRFIPQKEKGEVWIAASGLQAFEQLEEFSSLGYDAFLVGTHLMAEASPQKALETLLGGQNAG